MGVIWMCVPDGFQCVFIGMLFRHCGAGLNNYKVVWLRKLQSFKPTYDNIVWLRKLQHCLVEKVTIFRAYMKQKNVSTK
jgi:hypothetical protein